ncbi:MAG: DUF1638 domain-containing protein [Paracoccaceae bacterium]
MQISHDQLTKRGLAATGNTDRLLLLACGALAHEILALIETNGWQHMDLQCLPANLHLYPDRIPDAVSGAVAKARAQYDDIFVLYADCGTGGLLQKRCAELGVQMLEGPHCYSFFAGNTDFAVRAKTEFTAFYLTDFLVRQFDSFVWKPMGLDRHPYLRDTYFAHYEKLVYLAQTDDQTLDDLARQAAKRLVLPYERRFTGYGDLGTALADQT